MSDLLTIEEEEFAQWRRTHLVPSNGTASEKLQASGWIEQPGSTEAPAYLRWLYAANVHVRDKNFKAAGNCYAQAVGLLDRKAPAGIGFGVLTASCVDDNIDTVIANASDSGKLAAVFATLLDERHARFSAPQPEEVEPICRERRMHDPYHAVATFQTCLWYFHTKRPDLALCDLHNLCFLVDSVYYQNFRNTFFGTPRLARTGVVYESMLDGSLNDILDAVSDKLNDKSAGDIKNIVLNESPCKGRLEGEDVCFPCMPVEDLVPSDIITSVAACTGVRFDYSDVGETLPIDDSLRLSRSTVLEAAASADLAKLLSQLDDARRTIDELQEELAQSNVTFERGLDAKISASILDSFDPKRHLLKETHCLAFGSYSQRLSFAVHQAPSGGIVSSAAPRVNGGRCVIHGREISDQLVTTTNLTQSDAGKILTASGLQLLSWTDLADGVAVFMAGRISGAVATSHENNLFTVSVELESTGSKPPQLEGRKPESAEKPASISGASESQRKQSADIGPNWHSLHGFVQSQLMPSQMVSLTTLSKEQVAKMLAIGGLKMLQWETAGTNKQTLFVAAKAGPPTSPSLSAVRFSAHVRHVSSFGAS